MLGHICESAKVLRDGILRRSVAFTITDNDGVW